jgi:hypothetical protein
MKQIFTKFTIIIALLCFGATAKAQEDEYGRWINEVSESWRFNEKLPKAELSLAKTRWQKKFDVGSSEQFEWAGDYQIGDSIAGSFLRWSPQNGYVIFSVNKCTAEVQHFSYGSVVVTPSALVLIPEYNSRFADSNNYIKTAKSHNKLIFVRWRSVPFLVYDDEIEKFGNYVAGFFEGDLYYYWGVGDEKKGSIDDLPIFPAGYEKFVKKPFETKIIAVGKRIVKGHREEYQDEPFYESHTEVAINLGFADGVRKGMKFYILKSSATDALVITQVNSKTSKGIVIRSTDDDSHEKPSLRKDLTGLPLKVGLDVTTSDFKHLELVNDDFHIRKTTDTTLDNK